MDDLGLTIESAAGQLRVSPGVVADLIAGRQRITPVMSRQLGNLFGQSPTFWVNLQAEYDRRVESAARDAAAWSAELNRRLADQ